MGLTPSGFTSEQDLFGFLDHRNHHRKQTLLRALREARESTAVLLIYEVDRIVRFSVTDDTFSMQIWETLVRCLQYVPQQLTIAKLFCIATS